MRITSLAFLLFIFAVFVLYYLVPKKMQWWVLLVASIVFYLLVSAEGLVFVLITAGTVYISTVQMQKISAKQKAYLKENKATLTKEEKQTYKAANVRRRKGWMLFALLLNIGFLCFFKYFHFLLAQLNGLIAIIHLPQIVDNFKYIVPLGISFYTFQSTGYLLDVYWEYYEAEKNPMKVLLFTSFFPQMTQGPISDFQELSAELFAEHHLDYKNFSWGFQRMLWGFMKKMVLANTLAPWVQDVFTNYSSYSGLTTLIGAFMYSIQIYADFSGYMDIMCGLCEMLGIKLTENFERPYFSKSIAEYWRRWHISLGAWFKKYVYYPIGMSKWSRELGKKSKAKFGKRFGDMFPASIGLTITWLATGLWHGASWSYIAWGGINGLFIIFSMWMEPVYDSWKLGLKINENKWMWRAFQTIRTFILVTFIKVLPEVGTLSDGLGLWKRIFTNWNISKSFSGLLPFIDVKYNFLIVLGLTLLMFIISLLQRKKQVREDFNTVPWIARICVLAFCFIVIMIFGVRASVDGGFMYEQF